MNTSAYRRYMRVAVVGLVVVLPSALASQLAAQGGGQARRPVVTSAASAAGPSDHATALEPARTILRHFVGRWRVEIRFAGNFDGPPDASGTRVVETLFDDLRLQWTEALDSSQTRAQGILGFDSRTGQFYSTAVHSAGPGTELLTGTLDLAEPLVTFSPVAPAQDATSARQGMESFVLRMIDEDHFTWSPIDRGWRAVLTREQ